MSIRYRWQCGICDNVDFTDDGSLPDGWKVMVLFEDDDGVHLVCRICLRN